MTRSRNFFHGVWSGYVTTIVVSAISLLTIPIALSVLGKTTFALWSAVLQVTNFTNILDLGLGASLGRFIIDYKDHHDRKAYSQFLKSVFFLGALQGLLFALCALLMMPYLPALMGIPPDKSAQFKVLLILQSGVIALGFPLRPLGQLLHANQQFAWFNSANSVAALVNGALLLLGLRAGWGVYAYVVATWAAFVVVQLGYGFCVAKNRLLPPLLGARVSLKSLKPLAVFSSNVFVIGLGLKLIDFAPTLLITRKLGIQALADWTVGTRLVLFVSQLIFRIHNSSEPIFWEMFARKEFPRLRQRLLDLVIISGLAAALFGAGIVAINPPFIRYWTSNRVQWQTSADVVLVVWVAALTASAIFNTIPGTTKRLGAMKYVYVFEGLLVVSLAFLPVLHWHFHWQVALAMLICVAGFRLPYGMWRTWKDLQIPALVLLNTLARCGAVLLTLLAIALALRGATASLKPLAQVGINGALYGLLSLAVVFFLGLPPELKQRARQIFRSWIV